MRVEVRNKNIESALRVFKKKTSDVILEVRKRQFYEKPTAKRNRLKKAAELREVRRQANDGRVDKKRRH